MIDKERAKILAKAFEDMAVEEIATAYKEEKMAEKRYAIVRVENNCPYDVDGTEDYCYLNNGRYLKDCDYCKFWQGQITMGDTKEQLIKKVAQALELCMKKGYRTITSEEYAKFIVEFLGVE